MAEPVNPSFETQGAQPGEASAWTASITYTGELIADFGFSDGENPSPVEDFTHVSWGTHPYVYLVVPGTLTIFDALLAPQPSRAESFDRWSFHDRYQVLIDGGSAAEFDSNTHLVEDFTDASWGVSPYATTIGAGTGSFTESFESGWGSYVTTISGGTTAHFVLGGETAESFEYVAADLLFVIQNLGTGLCKTPGGNHGKPNGYRVTVISTGNRPTGVAQNQIFYFVSASLDEFQLSRSVSGTPITFTDSGSGDLYAHADERQFWTQTD